MQKVVMSVYIARRTFIVLCAVRSRCRSSPCLSYLSIFAVTSLVFCPLIFVYYFLNILLETNGLPGYRKMFKFIFCHYFSLLFFLSFVSYLPLFVSSSRFSPFFFSYYFSLLWFVLFVFLCFLFSDLPTLVAL